jgi:hypothetical protein
MSILISNAQSAFITKIHDHFLYVRNLAGKLHKSKKVTLLFEMTPRKPLTRYDGIFNGFASTLGLPNTISGLDFGTFDHLYLWSAS